MQREHHQRAELANAFVERLGRVDRRERGYPLNKRRHRS